MKNIVLIGMPACGKSTIGVLLAKTMGFGFIDTDLVIQERTGRLLQEIIDADGLDAFCKEEERAVLSVEKTGGYIIATGGSAVYSDRAMTHLKQNGAVYYLSLPPGEIKKRLVDIKTRGIAMKPGDDIEDVFSRRRALYERYADYTAECGGKTAEDIVEELRAAYMRGK